MMEQDKEDENVEVYEGRKTMQIISPISPIMTMELKEMTINTISKKLLSYAPSPVTVFESPMHTNSRKPIRNFNLNSGENSSGNEAIPERTEYET